MNNQPNMSEKELITDLLYEEKHLVKQYASDVVETACPSLRRIITTNLTECATDQHCVCDQMLQRSWYKIKGAQDQDVNTAKQDMQQLRSQTGI